MANGKRARITPEAASIIISRALERPRMRRTALAVRLQGELEDLGCDVPEVEVLERKISYYRNNVPDNPKDKPWSLGTLGEYPLPPQAIPIILAVQHNVQSHRSQEVNSTPKAGTPVTGPFTIREAEWVARLCFIEDIVTLEHWAHAYAIAERVSDVMGKDLDSSKMDKAVLADTRRHHARKHPEER